MAYEQATAATLKAQLPKFAGVADETIELWLTRARRDVDESWCEDDRAYAEILLAAHHMTLEGLGEGAEAELAAAGLSGMERVSSGKLSFSKSPGSAAAAAGSIGSTSYGVRYLDLLRSNRGGARVTPTGTAPVYPQDFGPYWFNGFRD